jgi:hypothetical protein
MPKVRIVQEKIEPNNIVNVLLIVIESVSRTTAEVTGMSEVFEYMEEFLGGVFFKHHNTKGFHSYANSDGLFTGIYSNE